MSEHSDGATARGAQPSARDIEVGLAAMVGSVFVLSVMDAAIKWLSADYHTVQIAFFRCLFGLLPVAFMVATSGGPAVLRTRRLHHHVGRALLGVASMFAFFLAFAYLPLADVTAISFAEPLFITALSMPILGERVGPRRWLAVAVGFLGVLVMVRPGGELFRWEALLALGGAFGFGLSMVLIRRMTATETGPAIVFYFTLTGLVTSGLALPLFWTAPSLPDLALLALVGLLGGSGSLLMTHAFRLAPAAVIAPFQYTAMIWAVLLGWLLWRDVPSAWVLAGAAIVIASGLYIMHRETRLGAAGRRRAAAPPA